MKRDPFPTQPSPGVFFRSKTHAGAEVFFRYLIRERESFVLVTGAYGTGKTLLCLRLVKAFQKASRRYPFLYVSVPNCAYEKILRDILATLGIVVPHTSKEKNDLESLLFEYFEKKNSDTEKFFIIMDDVHEYHTSVLNNLRCLANFNTSTGFFPFCLILFAHPMFLQKLASPDFGSFRQKIKRHYVLQPFDFRQTKEYIYFRLLYSGARGSPFFPDDSIEIIYKHSGGIPRVINNICEVSLIIGSSRGENSIGKDIVAEAVRFSNTEGKEQKSARERNSRPESAAKAVRPESSSHVGHRSAQPSNSTPLSGTSIEDTDFSNIGIEISTQTEKKNGLGVPSEPGRSFFAALWRRKRFKLILVLLVLVLLVLLGFSFHNRIFGEVYLWPATEDHQRIKIEPSNIIRLPINHDCMSSKSDLDGKSFEASSSEKGLGESPSKQIVCCVEAPLSPAPANQDIALNGSCSVRENGPLKSVGDNQVLMGRDAQIESYPYSLILSSNQSKANALAEISYLQKRGLAPVFLGKVSVGTKRWWVVYYGAFKDREVAEKGRADINRPEAIIRKVPYADLIKICSTRDEAEKIVSQPEISKFFPYIIKKNNNFFWVLVGAYITRKSALQGLRMLRIAGIDSQVVAR